MKDFFAFVLALIDPLFELWQYSQRPAADRNEEEEKQIAMRIIRTASDERARREIEGS